MFTDEEDEDSSGAVRYPCMPSLVSLQQMRNRLHLAYLGRKLMKWTTMATGRELRRLATEIHSTYNSFGDDIKNAFMLLARARYFYPNLNKMVTENCPHKASVVVGTKTKTVSGVKCVIFEVIESGVEPYVHLGIEKGGQQILEAKIAWLELLKRLVLMTELRKNFALLEEAHRNATKRHNVLCKYVVPRTNATLTYINDEIEEADRENFFRLKMILQVKKKLAAKCNHIRRVENCAACKIKFGEKRAGGESEDICIICEKKIPEFPKIEPIPEEPNILDEFKVRIDDIIETTEGMKEKGMHAESVEHFLKTASELRERLNAKQKSIEMETKKAAVDEEVEQIPSDVCIHKLCEICLKRYEDERAAAGAKLKRIREDEAAAKAEASKLAIKKEEDKPIDLELGLFETEEQLITKVIRVKNADGTISEERRVIKTKKTTKTPVKPPDKKDESGGQLMFQSSGTSSKSTPYSSGSRTIGMVSIKDRIKFNSGRLVNRKIKSETLFYISSLTFPIVRYCISSASMLSSCNSFTKLIKNNNEHKEHSEITLKEIYASSFELEETVHSFGQSMTTERSRSGSDTVHLKTE